MQFVSLFPLGTLAHLLYIYTGVSALRHTENTHGKVNNSQAKSKMETNLDTVISKLNIFVLY